MTKFCNTSIYFQFCRDKGGDLIEINNEDENDSILANKNNLGIVGSFWIGLIRTGSSSQQWSWISGDPLDYTNWEDGYPAATDCAIVSTSSSSFKWQDRDCIDTYSIVCEAT